jgi:hypothetical protein
VNYKTIVPRVKHRWGGKIFCISIQRTGTTSVGEFFKHFGFKVSTWDTQNKNKWSHHWYNGDYERIFSSNDFKSHRVFEDDPWWLPGFYKVLYWRFPDSKFVLMTRDSDKWFDSMVKHSGGKTPGNTRRHCKVYQRENEFYRRLDDNPAFKPHDWEIDNLLSLDGMDEHYKTLYDIHNRQVVEFFDEFSPKSLFVGKLEDPQKWQKMGKFFGLAVPADFEIHANKSK